ncbi:ef hand family protein [Stylonychia lemnae]|uniref:Ef hand family protein n=1 Tax=Stylonychia lemnae TaxID=5949 RepID=A0A077ZXD5_STYLE|nr:ef hand family protein [Stylonychia lemnae]|eukprot:CDW74571.1 ef hand family protein [Stylonychia lemnae]
MLSLETEARIAKIFLIEGTRQVLAEEPDFEPLTAFNRIDFDRKGRLDANDICEFLQANNVQITPQDAQSLITEFDTDQDGYLCQEEFIDLILPNNNNALRREAASRTPYYINKSQKLSFNTEYALVKVIQQEIILLQELNEIKTELAERFDFNVVDAYQLIQPRGLDFHIHQGMIVDFLSRNGEQLNEADIAGLMRRNSICNDVRLSFREFEKLILPNHYQAKSINLQRSSQKQNTLMSSHSIRNSAVKSSIISLRDSQYKQSSPLRQKKLKYQTPNKTIQSKIDQSSTKNLRSVETKADSSVQFTSPPKKFTIDPRDSLYIDKSTFGPSTLTTSFMHQKHQSEQKSKKEQAPLTLSEDPYYFSFSKVSPSILWGDQSVTLSQEYQRKVMTGKDQRYQFALPDRVGKFMLPYEEDELYRSLKEFISIDKDTEAIKCILALKTDFNLEEAYKIFDNQNRGTINLREFEEAMNIMSIYPRREEIQLLFQLYDADQDGKLNFNEFCAMVLPLDKNYASLIVGRNNYHDSRDYSRGNCFIPETQREFLSVLNHLLQAQMRSEQVRKLLEQRKNFDVAQSFQSLDKSKNGQISKQDIKQFLEERHYFPSDKDLAFLMKRFDKNQDQIISYSEYIQELNPKIQYL